MSPLGLISERCNCLVGGGKGLSFHEKEINIFVDLHHHVQSSCVPR